MLWLRRLKRGALMSRSIWQAMSPYTPPVQAIADLCFILKDVEQVAERFGTQQLDMYCAAKPLGVRPVQAEFSALLALTHMPLRRMTRMYVLDVAQFRVWVERECARLANMQDKPAQHQTSTRQQGSLF